MASGVYLDVCHTAVLAMIVGQGRPTGTADPERPTRLGRLANPRWAQIPKPPSLRDQIR